MSLTCFDSLYDDNLQAARRINPVDVTLCEIISVW